MEAPGQALPANLYKISGMSGSGKRICPIMAFLLSQELLLCSWHVAALLAVLQRVVCPLVLLDHGGNCASL